MKQGMSGNPIHGKGKSKTSKKENWRMNLEKGELEEGNSASG